MTDLRDSVRERATTCLTRKPLFGKQMEMRQRAIAAYMNDLLVNIKDKTMMAKVEGKAFECPTGI